MQTIALDLSNNPELKSLVADMEPGDKLDLRAAIKGMDDQSVTLTIEECSECADDSEYSEENSKEEDSKESKGGGYMMSKSKGKPKAGVMIITDEME